MDIDRYVASVDRWTVGSRERRQRLRTELEAHLREAERFGELDDVLARLGTPRQAAAAFSAGPPPRVASLSVRLAAALIDAFTFIAPMLAAYTISASASGPTPLALVEILWFGGIAWWAVALPILEWRFGRTSGKALLDLRVVSEDGTAPSLAQVAPRRSPLVLSGPFLVIDWAFAVSNVHRQRAFDLAARTLVVEDETEIGRRIVARAG